MKNINYKLYTMRREYLYSKGIILIQQKDEYSVQGNRNCGYRVCRDGVCSRWMHSRFTSHIPFSKKKIFKLEIDKIIERHGNKTEKE